RHTSPVTGQSVSADMATGAGYRLTHRSSGFPVLGRGTVGRLYPEPAASFLRHTSQATATTEGDAPGPLSAGVSCGQCQSGAVLPVRFRHTSERVLLVEGLCCACLGGAYEHCQPAPVQVHRENTSVWITPPQRLWRR